MTPSGSAPNNASPRPSSRNAMDAPTGTVVGTVLARVVLVPATVEELDVVTRVDDVEVLSALVVLVTSVEVESPVLVPVESAEELLHEAETNASNTSPVVRAVTRRVVIPRVCPLRPSSSWHPTISRTSLSG